MSWFKKKRFKTVEELAAYCKTPKKLGSWMTGWSGIKYVSDKTQYGHREYFASPAETLSSMKGDCEDYAWLAMDTLHAMGVEEAYVISVRSDSHVRHGVCAFYYGGDWYHMSNWGLWKCRKALVLKDVPRYVYKNWIGWTEYIVSEGKLTPVKQHWKSLEE